jgi:hypothetical protein
MNSLSDRRELGSEFGGRVELSVYSTFDLLGAALPGQFCQVNFAESVSQNQFHKSDIATCNIEGALFRLIDSRLKGRGLETQLTKRCQKSTRKVQKSTRKASENNKLPSPLLGMGSARAEQHATPWSDLGALLERNGIACFDNLNAELKCRPLNADP